MTTHWSRAGDAVGAEPVAEAFRTWMRVCARSGCSSALEVEIVAVGRSVRRITAETVRAVWSLPAYRAAAMDGIAVRACDTADASEGRPVELPPGRFDRIDTGDPMPESRDAVVMREHVAWTDSGAGVVTAVIAPGRNVRPVGEDIEAGRTVLPAGHRIRPVDAAALAGAGHTSVRVRRRPVVVILPTGDEVRPVGTSIVAGEVLDTNSLMLAGMVEEAGGEPVQLPIVSDRPERIAAAVQEAASRADLVLVIAGSSAGRDDHTAMVVRQLGQIAMHGVAMRPAHPVLLGAITGEYPVPVVGVPGYPSSAERAFTCFARPFLHRLLGQDEPARDGVPARLGCAVHSPAHVEEYVRMRLARVLDPRTGLESLVATPLRRGAGAVNAMVRTEAILRIPQGQIGFAAGTEVRPVPVEGAAFRAATLLVSGLSSPATEALLDLDQEGPSPHGSVQWTETDADEAGGALMSGLCHAIALRLEREDGRGAGVIAAMVEGAGDVTVLEIARTGSVSEVLVVPAGSFDSPPIVALRTVLRSTEFRRRLLRSAGYSGRSAGRETWHGPAARTSVAPTAALINGSDARPVE